MDRRIGLRARVIIAFGVAALLLSALLSTATYWLTRNNLLERDEELVVESASNSYSFLLTPGRLDQATSSGDYTGLLDLLARPEGAQHGILVGEQSYFSDTVSFSGDQVDENIRQQLFAGTALRQRQKIGDESYHLVGIPFMAIADEVAFVQATPLHPIDNTLRALSYTLLGASAITTALGTAFGAYAASRVLSPLSEIGEAAAQIASGDLSTRLADEVDPDLRSLVHSFNDMTSALESRIQRDARFASDVSHELRSPLMTLTGSAAVLERRRADMPERAQLALDLLVADIGRFKVLVEDLLEISHFDVGTASLRLEPVALVEFVRQAVLAAPGSSRTPDSAQPVAIVASADLDDLIINIDKRRIAQVIRNLSENADKYASGLTEVITSRHGDDVTIELVDSGPGVPPHERDLVFDRFARGSEGGRRGSSAGVGLGLSLVSEHLALHGGRIRVTDRRDGAPGARFIVTLVGVVT